MRLSSHAVVSTAVCKRLRARLAAHPCLPDCMILKVADQGGVGLRREGNHVTGRSGKACVDQGTNLAAVAFSTNARRVPRSTSSCFSAATDRHCDNEQREHARLFVAGKLNVYIAAAASIYGT